MRQYDAGTLEPDRSQIHRLLGLLPGRSNHERWFRLVEETITTARRILRPRALFRIDEVVQLTPSRIVLRSGAQYQGAIGAFLRNSEQMATFLVTIGSALERYSRRCLKDGKVMQGTIADAVASEFVEAAADRMQSEVQAWAQARGGNITPRFSPGYCGMHVRQQRVLFASMPAEQIHVRLTPSCLMLPVKSVSGLIGIGPADKVTPGGYPCELCTHEDCMQRRAAYNPNRGKAIDWNEVDDSHRPGAADGGPPQSN